MLTCQFEPSICKKENAPFRGKIELKPMAYEERLQIMEAQALAIAEAGEDEKLKTMALLKFAITFSRDYLEQYFVSSSIVRVEDGYAFDSLEKIKIDGPASTMIPEITNVLISGELSLGK